jgi:hypothetical protein
MLSKFFEALYLKVIVNIVVSGQKSVVYIELLNSKGVVKHDEATFNTTSLDNKMHKFIASYIKESPYHYISILDTSKEQGAVPTCSKAGMSDFHDFSESEYKCLDDKWAYYTSKNDLYELEKKYQKIGVDLVISPFVLLYNFFKDKINENKAMYILIEDTYMSLCVFENSELMFAQHMDMNAHNEEEIDDDNLMIEDDDMVDDILDEDILDDDDSIDLDDLNALDEIDDDVEDFGDIEDLDALEDIDEFSESKDVEEEFHEMKQPEPSVDEPAGFNQDYQRFSLIQNAIDNFYKDERYNSEFIETVYIADAIGVSKDLKTYLEEEMFLSVYIRNINLVQKLCSVTKMELK